MACKLPMCDPSVDKGGSVYAEMEMTIVLQFLFSKYSYKEPKGLNSFNFHISITK